MNTVKSFVTKSTSLKGLYDAQYSDVDRELSRGSIFDFVLSLISPKFKYINGIKVHTI